MKSLRPLLTLSVLTILAQFPEAASITTLYAGEEIGSNTGAIYFDVTVGNNPIAVTGFDVNAQSNWQQFGFLAYTMEGSHVGNEHTVSMWTFRTRGSGILAGPDSPSRVVVNTPFHLKANTIFGFALTLRTSETPPAKHFFTVGDGTNQIYSNEDISLSLGSYTDDLFTGNVVSPRVWNGTVYYEVVPEPASVFGFSFCLVYLLRRRRRVA